MNTQLYTDQLGDDLVSLYQYKRYHDEFLVVIVKNINLEILSTLKQKNSLRPIFFSVDDIQNGADVFPLELSFIQGNSTFLFGKDILKDRSFKATDIRTQLEYELRSKTIFWRQAMISDKDLSPLIKNVWEQLSIFVFGGLRLFEQKISGNWAQDLQTLAQHCQREFPALAAEITRDPKQKISKKDQSTIMQAIHTDLLTLTEFINHLKI